MTHTPRFRRSPIILLVLLAALLLIATPSQKVQATDDPPIPPIAVHPDTTNVVSPGDSLFPSSASSPLDLVLATLLALATM